MKKCWIMVLAWCVCPLVGRAAEASAPKGVTLTVYDIGFAQVTEARSVSLRTGESEVVFRSLPVRLDPMSVSFTPTVGRKGMEVLEQLFAYDLGDAVHMFNRYLGRTVSVVSPSGRYEGELVGAPRLTPGDIPDVPLAIRRPDGSAVLFVGPEDLREVGFPSAAREAFLEPTLIWKVDSRQDGPQNLRLSYLVDRMSWDAGYEMVLLEGKSEAQLAVRVGLNNQTGGTFEGARVRCISTEKGAPPVLAGRPKADVPRSEQRYGYDGLEPTLARLVSGVGAQQIVDLPRPVTLPANTFKYVQLKSVENLPVSRFYVYDGVRFDQYQRNRRNDWNYGTESHGTVQTHLEFANSERDGLGFHLPGGRFRLYEQRRDGSLNLVGEDLLAPTAAGDKGHVLLGPARGLTGERERVTYSEVRPLHEYDESFRIQVGNETSAAVEVRVVEHLYRWPRYEIVKADTEYQQTGPQRIEFRPRIPAGAQRTITYTVRYSW